MRWLKLGEFRKKTVTRVTTGLGSSSAVLVAGLYGAFGTPQEPTPQVAANLPIEAGQWRVRPVRAWVAEEQVHGVSLKDGQRALVLEVDMTNRTSESSRDYGKVFRLDPTLADGADEPTAVLTRDQKMIGLLHPQMEERMAFIWQVPATFPLPEQLPVTIYAKTYKPRDNLYGAPGWFNEHPVGVVPLRLEQPEQRSASKGG